MSNVGTDRAADEPCAQCRIPRVDRLLEAPTARRNATSGFAASAGSSSRFWPRPCAGVSHPRVLDAGCGTGRNLRMLDPFGQPCGIDLNALGLSFAARQGRRTVARATVTAPALPGRRVRPGHVVRRAVRAGRRAGERRRSTRWRGCSSPAARWSSTWPPCRWCAAATRRRSGAERRRYTLDTDAPLARAGRPAAGAPDVHQRLAVSDARRVCGPCSALFGWPVPGIELEVPAGAGQRPPGLAPLGRGAHRPARRTCRSAARCCAWRGRADAHGRAPPIDSTVSSSTRTARCRRSALSARVGRDEELVGLERDLPGGPVEQVATDPARRR